MSGRQVTDCIIRVSIFVLILAAYPVIMRDLWVIQHSRRTTHRTKMYLDILILRVHPRMLQGVSFTSTWQAEG